MFDTKIGRIFFIGIGGIGMSGIAEVLVNQSYEVAGSDISENPNIERLRKIGVKVNVRKDLSGSVNFIFFKIWF